jgi:hypothetical protein
MDAPLTVTLTCRRCDDTATLTFDYAVVDPKPAEVDPTWDGIVLFRTRVAWILEDTGRSRPTASRVRSRTSFGSRRPSACAGR